MAEVDAFRAYCARVAERLARMLELYFRTQKQASAPRLQEAMVYALTGGKAVRATLCLASGELFGPIGPGHWQVALAIEAMHSYSLVHDDLPAMDNALERRGQPSVHAAYDEATAILTGDALQALAFEWLAQAELPALLRVELLENFAHTAGVHGMAGGQNLDMLGGKTEADLRRIDGLKTAALIMWSVDAGAQCNGADAAKRLALRQYAQCLGLAFQLTDDLLDLQSPPGQLGKPVRQAQKEAHINLATLLGAKAAQARAKALIAQAHTALDALEQPADLLRAGADFVLTRTR